MITLPKAGITLALLTLAASALIAPPMAAAAPPPPTYTNIEVPGAAPGSTQANGINDYAVVAGTYLDAAGNSHGFLEGYGCYLTGDIPGATATIPTGINNNGQTVGYYQTGYDSNGNALYHGFVVTGASYTTLDVPGALPGSTFAYGINNKGQVVGSYSDTAYNQHGFLLSGGKYTTVDDPSGFGYTIATGINDKGQIVGYYTNSSYSENGFLLSGGKYTTISGPTSNYGTVVNGINASGQLARRLECESAFGVHGRHRLSLQPWRLHHTHGSEPCGLSLRQRHQFLRADCRRIYRRRRGDTRLRVHAAKLSSLLPGHE